MHVDDLLHRLFIGKADVVKEAATQEGVGQFLLVVAGDEDDRPVARLDHLTGFVDIEFHAIEFAQQVIGKLDVRFVDLVDQQHRLLFAIERFPQLSFDDVVADFVHATISKLRIAQPRHSIVFVQALLRLGGGFHVPFVDRLVQRAGDLFRQQGLAGAGFAFDQQRALQGN